MSTKGGRDHTCFVFSCSAALLIALAVQSVHGAVIIWDGGGDGASWHDPLNWSGDVLPGQDDDVILIAPDADPEVAHASGATIINSFHSEETITISGGSITINADSEAQGDLRFTGGALSGAGDLLAMDGVFINAGEMNGPGIVTLGGSATMTVSTGGNTFAMNRVIEHGGTVNFAGGTIVLGQALNVLSNGKVNVNGAGAILDGGGAIFNEGRITKNNAGTWSVHAPLTSTGLVQAFGGTLNLAGGFTQDGGITTVSATLSAQGGIELIGGVINGSGEIAGNILNPTGTIDPGNPIGILTITGDYTQANDGELRLELSGLAPGIGYDRLHVTGTAALSGDIRLLFMGGFEPNPGAVFTVVTAGSIIGAFDFLSTCGIMDMTHSNTNVSLELLGYIVGDIDCDGDVDGADLAQLLGSWSIPPGTAGCDGELDCPADLNDDGLVNAGDLAILLGNWG